MRRANAEPLRRLLRFDEPPAEYELLENEQGEPPFFGGWRSGARQTARRESAVPPVSAQLEENLRRLSGEYRRDINTDLILRRFSLPLSWQFGKARRSSCRGGYQPPAAPWPGRS